MIFKKNGIKFIDILRSELHHLQNQMREGGMSEGEEDSLQLEIEQKLEDIFELEEEEKKYWEKFS